MAVAPGPLSCKHEWLETTIFSEPRQRYLCARCGATRTVGDGVAAQGDDAYDGDWRKVIAAAAQLDSHAIAATAFEPGFAEKVKPKTVEAPELPRRIVDLDD